MFEQQYSLLIDLEVGHNTVDVGHFTNKHGQAHRFCHLCQIIINQHRLMNKHQANQPSSLYQPLMIAIFNRTVKCELR